jgi:hypothetical protein
MILAAEDMDFVEKMMVIVTLWRADCYEELRYKDETCPLLRVEAV